MCGCGRKSSKHKKKKIEIREKLKLIHEKIKRENNHDN